MIPETIIQILVQCNDAVPQHLMIWNAREHRFEVYVSQEATSQ